MGAFYFDESIHDEAGFIIGAYVYSESNIDSLVYDALIRVGLQPGVDEFKSSARMDTNVQQQTLRDALKNILQRTKLGLLVMPSSERHSLGCEAVTALTKIIHANNLSAERHDVFWDEGIAFVGNGANIKNQPSSQPYSLHLNQLSHEVGGIQLADLAAHTFSMMLLESLGVISKTVKAGPNSGYEPDLDIELGFELWASIRYCLFSQDQIDFDADPIGGLTLDTASYALHIANSCNPILHRAAMERFGSNYIGCIH